MRSALARLLAERTSPLIGYSGWERSMRGLEDQPGFSQAANFPWLILPVL
jgi:hypothetical protein